MKYYCCPICGEITGKGGQKDGFIMADGNMCPACAEMYREALIMQKIIKPGKEET